jgi:hypothetical protein
VENSIPTFSALHDLANLADKSRKQRRYPIIIHDELSQELKNVPLTDLISLTTDFIIGCININ